MLVLTPVVAPRIVLSAGAFGSPAILLRSGVGPAAQLCEHGIEVVRSKTRAEGSTRPNFGALGRYQVGAGDETNVGGRGQLIEHWVTIRPDELVDAADHRERR